MFFLRRVVKIVESNPMQSVFFFFLLYPSLVGHKSLGYVLSLKIINTVGDIS